MKNIEPIKKQYLERYLKKISLSDEKVDEDIVDLYSLVSEVKAFIDISIPDEFKKLTIFDLTGKTKKEIQAINIKDALRVKDTLCNFMWGVSWEELSKKFNSEKKIDEYLKSHSKMYDRYTNGNNVAIFGDSSTPCGRTMIASIILKEAIRLRLLNNRVRNHTYEWINFHSLKKFLIDGKQDIVDIKVCDWLVIDCIDVSNDDSSSKRQFIKEILDPFFFERYRNCLPTILVFQYNIFDEMYPLDKVLGSEISNFVTSKKTCKISLTEN